MQHRPYGVQMSVREVLWSAELARQRFDVVSSG
jgi:hypothetical protein